MEKPLPLSAKFVNSFAYDTVQTRIPHILTKVIDTCHRHISVSQQSHGESGRDDAIEVVSKLSKFRNEIMTNKVLTLLDDGLIDKDLWNTYLKEFFNENGHDPSYFTASWMYTECYVYRKILSILNSSKYMSDFDPFQEQKHLSLDQSLPSLKNLAIYFNKVINSSSSSDLKTIKQNLLNLLQISLWGNKFDLSISSGEENAPTSTNLLAELDSSRHALLIDDSDKIWKNLEEVKLLEKVRIDIVLDNFGFELFTDLVLADFFLSYKLCDQVVFHPKPLPWFVSDVTIADFRLFLKYLASSEEEALSTLGKRWISLLEKSKFSVIEDSELLRFWCLPNTYQKMSEVDPILYKYLSRSNLIIFKGDLNYRKLVGDLNWPPETTFRHALQGFAPSKLCSLRTLKAEVVVGLDPSTVQKLCSKEKDWMVTGNYGVIQFSGVDSTL